MQQLGCVMNKSKKMSIEDLIPHVKGPYQLQPAPMDWSESDELFFASCPECLTQPLSLSQVILAGKLLEVEGIDANYVNRIISQLVNDTLQLKDELTQLQATYTEGKKHVREEDAFMHSTNMCQLAFDWIDKYDNSVGKGLRDVIDYINDAIPDHTKKIAL